MYRTLAGLVLSLLAALTLVKLTFSATVDEPAEFRFVNGTEPKTLDPHLATGSPEGRILEAVFEGLTRRDAKTLRPVPGMAESWQVSEDGRQYTFRIRKDARWSDGKPVTAHDFVYSWKRLLDPATAAEYAYILYMVRHAEAYNSYAAHIEALRGPIKNEIRAVADRGASQVQAAALQRAFEKSGAFGALQHAQSQKLVELLARRKGQVSRAELSWLLSQLDAEARQLEKALRRAQSHFGVDEGMYAPDAHTLVVELRAPTPYFLEITAFYPAMPVPRWLVEAPETKNDWFLPEKIVNNGPFHLSRWIVNDRIRLVKNETYWNQAQVRSHSIDALPVENAATALNLYLTGEVHWLPSLYPQELVHRFRKRSDFYSGPAMIVYYYRFNCERGPLRDRRVRHAINLAIDRKVIVEQVLGLGQLPAHHMVPPGMPGYEQPESQIRHDPKRARELLAEAGYPDGKGLPEIGILYNTLESHKKIAEVIADQLKRVLKIEVSAYNQEWQSYLATMRLGDYDIARAGWIGDYLDPNTFLDIWVTNGGNNQTGFSSPRYDALIRAAGNITGAVDDPELLYGLVSDQRAAKNLIETLEHASNAEEKAAAFGQLRMLLLSEAEAILVREEFPIMPVYFYVASGFVSPKVSGFYSELRLPDGTRAPNLQDLHPLYGIEVKE